MSLNKARKKQRYNLSDNYIVQNLATLVYHSSKNNKLDRKSVTKEVIAICRKTIILKRELNFLKNKI